MNKHSQAQQPNSDSLTEDEMAMQRVLNAHLDSQVDELDYNITSKLSAARHKALAGESRLGRGRFEFVAQQWPRVLMASCAVVLVAFLALQLDNSAPESEAIQVAVNEPTHFIEDLNILSAADDIDFYQSVEFLEWMESNAS